MRCRDVPALRFHLRRLTVNPLFFFFFVQLVPSYVDRRILVCFLAVVHRSLHHSDRFRRRFRVPLAVFEETKVPIIHHHPRRSMLLLGRPNLPSRARFHVRIPTHVQSIRPYSIPLVKHLLIIVRIRFHASSSRLLPVYVEKSKRAFAVRLPQTLRRVLHDCVPLLTHRGNSD